MASRRGRKKRRVYGISVGGISGRYTTIPSSSFVNVMLSPNRELEEEDDEDGQADDEDDFA